MLMGVRVYLRPVEREDLEKIVAWRNGPETWKYFFNKFPLSKAKQEVWFESLLRQEDRLFLVICRIEDDVVVGTIELAHIDAHNQSAEIGNVLIVESIRGQKLMTEAMELLICYAMGHLNLHRLYLHVLANNSPAIALCEKLGFAKEGRLKDAQFLQGEFQDVLVMSLIRKGSVYGKEESYLDSTLPQRAPSDTGAFKWGTVEFAHNRS